MAPRVSDKALLMSMAYASRRIFPALSFHVKLHMHQLHALASEQINRHGNHAPPPRPPPRWLAPTLGRAPGPTIFNLTRFISLLSMWHTNVRSKAFHHLF